MPWRWFLLQSSVLLKVGHRDPVQLGAQGTTAENSEPCLGRLFKTFMLLDLQTDGIISDCFDQR